jgi:hypothetical protein
LKEELRDIVFLCNRLPDEHEFKMLSSFPGLYYVVGDTLKSRDLLRGGVVGAWKGINPNPKTIIKLM